MSESGKETGFTPGPWRAEGPDMFGDFNICHPADALAVGAVVSNLRAPEQVAANAALIAAAPALYAALEYALPIVERYAHTQGDNAEFHAEITAPIRSALLLSTGGTGNG